MLAAEVTVSSPDFGQLEPMVKAAKRELEAMGVTETPGVAVADSGYWNEEQMDNVVANEHVQVLIPPDAGKRDTPRPGWDGGRYASMRETFRATSPAGSSKTQGDGRAGVRTDQAQPAHQSVSATRRIRRPLGVAPDHRHPQPTEAPHVHAHQTHAAILVPDSGEVAVSKLKVEPVEAVSFLEGLGPSVHAVYEAGPTGFGLARVARERGIDVRVAAPVLAGLTAGERFADERPVTPRAAQARRGSSRSRARASSRRSCGRQPPLTELIMIIASGTLPGGARATGRPSTVARRLAKGLWAASSFDWLGPCLDGEPRRTPGLEVKLSHIILTTQSMRLDLPLVWPRECPVNAGLQRIKRRRPLTESAPYQPLYFGKR